MVGLDVERVQVGVVVLPGTDDLVELLDELLGVFDGAGEGDGPLHGAVVALRVGGFAELVEALLQAVPAAGDAGGVVEVELAVLGELALERAGDVGLVDREHEDFVVGEEAVLDGKAEAEAVEFLAEEGGVVHGGDLGGALLRLGLGRVAVDPRGRGHVEALGGLDVAGVVDLDEVGLVLPREGDAGGAVGLVADDQVEGGQARRLRGGDAGDGVVGGEDDGRARGGAFLQLGQPAVLVDELLVVGGGGEGEVLHLDVAGVVGRLLLALADAAVGADGEAGERAGGLGGPLAQGLGEQRQRGHKEEDLPGGGECLGDLERGEGLAGAAGHDELPAVGGSAGPEGGDHVVERLLLVGAEGLLRVALEVLRPL